MSTLLNTLTQQCNNVFTLSEVEEITETPAAVEVVLSHIRLDEVVAFEDIAQPLIESTGATVYRPYITGDKIVFPTTPSKVKPVKCVIVKQASAIDVSSNHMFDLRKKFALLLLNLLIDNRVEGSISCYMLDLDAVKVTASPSKHHKIAQLAASVAEEVGTTILKVKTTSSSIRFKIENRSPRNERVLLKTAPSTGSLTMAEIVDGINAKLAPVGVAGKRSFFNVSCVDFFLSDPVQSQVAQAITEFVVEHQLPVVLTQITSNLYLEVKQYYLY